jgi:hypothetical protein
MNPKLPVVSAQEAIRVFEKVGYEVVPSGVATSACVIIPILHIHH